VAKPKPNSRHNQIRDVNFEKLRWGVFIFGVLLAFVGVAMVFFNTQTAPFQWSIKVLSSSATLTNVSAGIIVIVLGAFLAFAAATKKNW